MSIRGIYFPRRPLDHCTSVLSFISGDGLLVFLNMSKLLQRGHIIKHKSASTLATRLGDRTICTMVENVCGSNFLDDHVLQRR